jgi:hypothetical protein
MRRCAAAMLAAALAAGASPSQAAEAPTAAVGMRLRTEVVLPGSELVPAPSTSKTKVVVRVLNAWVHGEHRRYELEWTGLEPGSHDLAKYLVRKDGSPVDGLPEVKVNVTSVLPKGHMQPSELPPEPADRMHGYSALQVVTGVLWGAGLLAILFFGRKYRRGHVTAAKKPTLADRLRPLVESVASGSANTAAKAELERLMVAFWRSRLDLAGHKAADAIVAISRHPEAGALLRQLEQWLHVPSPPVAVDVGALLAPYRSVTAESFEPLPRGGAS